MTRNFSWANVPGRLLFGAGVLFVAAACSSTNFSGSGEREKHGKKTSDAQADEPPRHETDEQGVSEPDEDLEETEDLSAAPAGTLEEDEEVTTKTCTINLAYEPSSIQCSISVTDRSNIWWESGFAPFFWNQPQQDPNATWISPLPRQENFCPSTSSETLIYVSWFDAPADGTYNIVVSNDEGGGFRLWKGGNPKKEVARGEDMAAVSLKKGRYSLLIEGNDTGIASAMAATVRDAKGVTLRASGPTKDWCIFRTPRGTDLKTFIPGAAGCRPCFGTEP